MMIHNDFILMVEDIKRQYGLYRKMGRTRDEAIQVIRNGYAQELLDPDDRLAVLIGLSLSLCKKKELFESIATETLNEIRCVNQHHDKGENTYLTKVEKCLEDKASYGKEATYKQARIYVPNWKIGDTFSHELTYPASEKLGIKGWFILLYKVGEFVDELEAHRQLMYVSICAPDNIPSCEEDLQKLGFLPMMCMGDKVEYLAQIKIKSKKAEESYGLSKIGYFPNILPPEDSEEENPLTAMPLFGKMKREDLWPAYEDLICRQYKEYGKRERK